MHFQKITDGFFLSGSRYDCIHKSAVENEFRFLESGGKRLLCGLLDDTRTRKADHSSGFREDNVAFHGKACGNSARGGIGEESQIEKLKALEPVLIETLPLTLEEVFVYETSALGYQFDEILGGDQ